VTRRVLQAMAGARHGGAEIFFERLAAAITRADSVEQRLLIRSNPDRARTLRTSGIAVAETSFGGPLDLASRCAFRREIAAFRPDIVLTWMSRATRFCPRGGFTHVARLGGYYDLRHYRRCDHLVGNTRAIVDYAVAHGWPRERVHYLPNFVPDARGAQPLPRAEPGAAAGPDARAFPLGLALGRFHPNKGFDLLLDALAAFPGLHLWLAGDGGLRADLEAQAIRLGLGERLRFLGWRNDVAALLASVDFLVCPSRHEPLGNVVIEAWAAGVPVVAVASDGPAGLIVDGESGLLVPLAGDARALAASMMRLAGDRDLRARLASGGRRAYEAEFTEEKVVGAYLGFFSRVAR
jgi:glycosyltransferase involved in cell wall biosynthesis